MCPERISLESLTPRSGIRVENKIGSMDQVKQSIGDESKQKDPAVLEKLAVLVKEIKAVGQDIIVPMLQFTDTVDQKIAERAYRPDLMEKELKILAHIDRQIAKDDR